MKYAIVYSSKTGNTAALADRLHDILPHEHCVYFGDTSHYSPELGADLIFAGFWTDKGSCDDRTRLFLKNLQNTMKVSPIRTKRTLQTLKSGQKALSTN